jgi:pSer/pThr/pTyr-binding forkhead associated (FHA) protein
VSGHGHPDRDLLLELVGTEGLLKGHRLLIRLGESAVVGRSRGCDLSTRRSKAFLRANEETQRRILADKTFLMVSRRHVQITFHEEDRIEIRDLSKNGTFVNDRRVDRAVLDGKLDEDVELRLSRSEVFRLRRSRGS